MIGRPTLTTWLRAPLGLLAFVLVMTLMADYWTSRTGKESGWPMFAALAIVIAVGVIAPNRIGVATDNTSHSTSPRGHITNRGGGYSNPGGGGGYSNPGPSGGYNDPTITNPYRDTCKSQLGFGDIYDSNLTNEQYVEVMACATNGTLYGN